MNVLPGSFNVTLSAPPNIGIWSATNALGQVQAAAGATPAALDVEIKLFNSNGTGLTLSRAIRSDAEYEGQVTGTMAQIAAQHSPPPVIDLVTIETEEDGNKSTATQAEYITELTDGIATLHGLGYNKVADGSLTTSGLNLYYWANLFYVPGAYPPNQTFNTAANMRLADAFARAAFVKNVSDEILVQDDLPNSCYPSRNLYTTNRQAYNHLAKVQYLANAFVAGVAGMDYANFHWYEVDPGAELPAMCNCSPSFSGLTGR